MPEKKKEEATTIAPPGVEVDTKPMGEEEIIEPSTLEEPQPETPPLDSRFEGKTIEDVIADYQSLEDHSSRLAQQLGDAKGELIVRDKMAQQQVQPSQQQGYNPWQQPPSPPVQPEAVNRDDDFVDNPTKTTREIIREEMGQFAQAMRQQAGVNQATIAKQMAKAQNPQLFQGLDEQALDQMMYGGVQGGQLNPEFLGNPEGWAMAAWQLRGKDSGFSITPSPPRPTSPTGTELPTQVKPLVSASPAPIAPPGWNEAWDKMGNLSPEDRVDILKKIKEGK